MSNPCLLNGANWEKSIKQKKKSNKSKRLTENNQ